ncbi:Cytosol non-specific dipeptidase [Aedoeadaptatus ivorii]|uniref:Cytosol non-specific dipeptidase n=1 Tax=Aedoeadaptatus ivorii TaxID=54006 RepID=A0A3S5BW48_9FIRM|nr:aminoacyl-histidine dipeptidase [Peptoniphilus ivorii]VEJ35471.1 Cytosol non-specific dipeptidase [Peptoniphilus ivorii]
MIKGLQGNFPVLQNFATITDIPRCSKEEGQIRDFLVRWAKERGLEFMVDEIQNVIVKKPASLGYEDEPTVILQGHMDMVCEAKKGHVHDFCKDPIEAKVDGDFIVAENTTLGADNGIAVAMMMAVLEGDFEHPALECLFTVDEETGMTGAINVDGSLLSGRTLINLDSEDEGVITVGCAGGLVNNIAIRKAYKESDSDAFLEVAFGGFVGGHSGQDIDDERGNPILQLARVLKEAADMVDFDLADFSGGSKPNAIPRDAEAIVAVKAADKDALIEALHTNADIVASEFKATDPDIHLEISDAEPKKVLSDAVKDGILGYLLTAPNGVNTFSKKIDGMVESSTNIGVAKNDDERIVFTSQIRSDVETKIREIALKNRTAGEMAGAEYEELSAYPAWEYAETSSLREKAKELWKSMYGEEPVVETIHAGLECGLLQDAIGKMDMISVGPDMSGVHAPGEKLSISSTERFYEYLLALLKLKG